nr:immunoglobulin heavy chain junction region [Macaca mulatta]MOX58567.1 immunoglobulin heavy chain junction region [Macaca mulatta]MOX58652.1 immunoglobulin heavy chain junction region [Macaca mulatta]MOX58683.1 immunoglobulin heavy chain junction region [Macaca mulatta]MOX59111.1 immunoglobulin heavy chain junction region [Macaca mulatta]
CARDRRVQSLSWFDVW